MLCHVTTFPGIPVARLKSPAPASSFRGISTGWICPAMASRARVIDYKTGRLRAKMAEVVIKGGSELQRCLYAFAVKTLLGQDVDVDAALLYPAAMDSVQKLFPLQDIEATLGQLASAIDLARRNIEAGLALPGIDAADDYNDLAFALPGSASYLPRKMALAKERLGEAANVWEAK